MVEQAKEKIGLFTGDVNGSDFKTIQINYKNNKTNGKRNFKATTRVGKSV
jgi:hypothetical protein